RQELQEKASLARGLWRQEAETRAYRTSPSPELTPLRQRAASPAASPSAPPLVEQQHTPRATVAAACRRSGSQGPVRSRQRQGALEASDRYSTPAVQGRSCSSPQVRSRSQQPD